MNVFLDSSDLEIINYVIEETVSVVVECSVEVSGGTAIMRRNDAGDLCLVAVSKEEKTSGHMMVSGTLVVDPLKGTTISGPGMASS